jgi:hypothetical protein
VRMDQRWNDSGSWGAMVAGSVKGVCDAKEWRDEAPSVKLSGGSIDART